MISLFSKRFVVVFYLFIIVCAFSCVAKVDTGIDKSSKNVEGTYTFEKPDALAEWHIIGDKVDLVKRPGGKGHCIRIERKDTSSWTYIIKEFSIVELLEKRFGMEPGKRAKLRFTFNAEIQSELDDFGPESYHEGKFIAVVSIDGEEKTYKGNNFRRKFNFKKRTFRLNLPAIRSDDAIVELRIGLQNSSGKMYVDNVNIKIEKR